MGFEFGEVKGEENVKGGVEVGGGGGEKVVVIGAGGSGKWMMGQGVGRMVGGV